MDYEGEEDGGAVVGDDAEDVAYAFDWEMVSWVGEGGKGGRTDHADQEGVDEVGLGAEHFDG